MRQRRGASSVAAPTALILALAATLLGTACGGPPPPPELTPARAEEIVRESFPSVQVTVQELLSDEGQEGRLRAAAEFMGSDVTFVFTLGEQEWELAAVEQGGVSHTPGELREIAATLGTMRAVADALGRYREEHGELPPLDDQAGLQELVPEFYPEDGELSDVWGEPLRYRVQRGEYTLISVGPDGEPGTRDDLVIVDTRQAPAAQR